MILINCGGKSRNFQLKKSGRGCRVLIGRQNSPRPILGNLKTLGFPSRPDLLSFTLTLAMIRELVILVERLDTFPDSVQSGVLFSRVAILSGLAVSSSAATVSGGSAATAAVWPASKEIMLHFKM